MPWSKYAAEDRRWLNSVFQYSVSNRESVHYLIPRIKVKIIDTDSTAKDVGAEEAISKFLSGKMVTKIKMLFTRRLFRRTGKA